MTTQQDFPKINQPFVNPESGVITMVWQKLLANMWQKLGGGQSTVSGAVFTYQDGMGNIVFADALTGQFLGYAQLSNPSGGPAVPLVPVGPSPWQYQAPSQGWVRVYGAQVEFSRDLGVTWYAVTVQGGAIPVLLNDIIRLTWYGPDLPLATFFPNL